jgi:hypothetical protein
MINTSNARHNSWKIPLLILGGILLLSLVGSVWLSQKNNPNAIGGSIQNFLSGNAAKIAKGEAVSAKEIYPLFECPCCGKLINKCACPMAKERRNYIDALIEIGGNMPKDKIITAYAKKYGLDSFADKEKRAEFRKKLAKEAPVGRPIISLTPGSYDFGDVSQRKGIATTFFEVKNEGKSDLIINKLETSCGCTSASIVYQGKEGPKFGMDMGQKIPKWQIAIPAGETARLKVYYDPNFHKNFQGTAIREITVFSNDPVDSTKKVQVELNQVK